MNKPGKSRMAVITAAFEIGAPTDSPIFAISSGDGVKITHKTIARRMLCFGSSNVQASSCGISRIAVNVKSTMKSKSHAGRDHPSGDQIMVPNVVTKSRKIWLKIATAHKPNSGKNDGVS